MNSLFRCVVFLLFTCSYSASAQEYSMELVTATGKIHGTLAYPSVSSPIPVVLLIAGSGPTDRNGNQPGLYQPNNLKLLAVALSKNGIASLRFDKRAIGESVMAARSEFDLRFDTYVSDACEWIELLSKDKRFSRIVVAGHSEGSLIGMISCAKTNKTSAFISIAGAGRPADVLLKDQMSQLPDGVKETVFSIIDMLKRGETLENIPESLNSLFRPSVQPYMISWLRYDPQIEIKKLDIPVLILQGNTDIQVSELDADMLSQAKPEATKRIILQMNHVLKQCDSKDQQSQNQTYTNPELPIHPQLMNEIVAFIRQIK